MARHIEVLQSTIGATGEVLDAHEARVSKKGLPEASIKYVVSADRRGRGVALARWCRSTP